MKTDMLFYDAYENFYSAAKSSGVFSAFCREAYGADFSQDGFSDLAQVERIITVMSLNEDSHILDIGCGNGKMLRYLQERTGAYIHGFDYSDNAIASANEMKLANADFRMDVIGEAEYPTALFDLIITMDTMYFAENMTAFVSQMKRWLKPEGRVFIAYQEGDIMPKTANSETTVIAQALRANDMRYTVENITCETYEMLKRKRASAEKFKEKFIDEGREWMYELLVGQTECAAVPFDKYRINNARYIYIASK